jgi:SAM-dependent methyltransferase
MTDHRAHLDANRRAWDQWAGLHVRAPFYDVPAFEGGALSLTELELEEVGEVRDLSLLHLQCHFGLDTLSWARRGARVTGLDFSEAALAEARALAIRVGLQDRARFVAANVYDAPDALGGERFDVVFTSFGVLSWLPALDPWAEVVARCLRPGGRFHLVELHPFLGMFDDRFQTIDYPYDGGPIVANEQGSYADRNAPVVTRTYGWNHGLATVVGALLRAGLVVDRLREWTWTPFPLFPDMETIAPRRHRLRRFGDRVPLTYAVAARLPSAEGAPR